MRSKNQVQNMILKKKKKYVSRQRKSETCQGKSLKAFLEWTKKPSNAQYA